MINHDVLRYVNMPMVDTPDARQQLAARYQLARCPTQHRRERYAASDCDLAA